jgi:putative membrane protein
VGARFLDAEARAAFKQAIEAVENASAVEVVVAVRRRSHRYLHANVVVGALLAFVGLAVMLFTEQAFSLTSILVDPFVVALLAGGVVELTPAVKRLLTTPAARRRLVARAARATFVERGVHRTMGRTGMLVYCSWLERQIALVADVGLADALPEGALATLEAALTAAMPGGGAAVARALAATAEQMARALPHSDDDINELPDDIDEEPR